MAVWRQAHPEATEEEIEDELRQRRLLLPRLLRSLPIS